MNASKMEQHCEPDICTFHVNCPVRTARNKSQRRWYNVDGSVPMIDYKLVLANDQALLMLNYRLIFIFYFFATAKI